MPKNVSFVLFLRLFCVKDSYNFNTNKHFNTLFFPFSHILYQWLTLRRVFPFLKIVVYMAFHNAIVLYPTENLMIINDIHKLITLLWTFNRYKNTFASQIKTDIFIVVFCSWNCRITILGKHIKTSRNGQAPCPSGASTLPQVGKHSAQNCAQSFYRRKRQ